MHAKGEWMQLRPWQRHSLVLAVAGFVYVCVGMTYLIVPLTADRTANLALALIVPIQWWGVLWVAVGVLSFASTRWPPQSKTWGYTTLAGLAGAWGSVYLLSVVFLHAPHVGLTGALVWYLVAFLWWGISGLINPDDVPKVV